MKQPQALAALLSTSERPSTPTGTAASATDADSTLAPYEPIPHYRGAPRPELPKTVDLVRLTPGEVEEALRCARAHKMQRLIDGLRRWEWSNPPAKKSYTAEELFEYKFAEAVAINPAFNLSDGYDGIFWALCLYFTNDRRFLELDKSYSLDKGLILAGGTGRGKSFLMRLFRTNPRQGYAVTKAEALVDEYEASGPSALFKYYRGPGGRCFDDVGVERPLGHHYKADENTFAKVYLARADAFDTGEITGPQTHFTTNLPVGKSTDAAGEPTLNGRYFNRVTSRLAAMQNLIAFPPQAPDRRK